MDNSYRKDLHTWFGLSYAAFLVIPRVAMMQMPKEWQEQMSELLHQYNDTINTGAFGVHSCFVTVKNADNKFMKMPEQLVNYRHPSQDTIATLLDKE